MQDYGGSLPPMLQQDSLTKALQGQLFMMGFDGTSVTPHIRTLIEEHHVGCILLTAKNLKC
jgi:hypothetical protein